MEHAINPISGIWGLALMDFPSGFFNSAEFDVFIFRCKIDFGALSTQFINSFSFTQTSSGIESAFIPRKSCQNVGTHLETIKFTIKDPFVKSYGSFPIFEQNLKPTNAFILVMGLKNKFK
ncbi:hypothetical protein MMU07_00575 [Aquiflexum sp. LQ15W]|uniref:hypothetical protein n=1 Tax=Cognataquiflexum nitidum TaxID=2922272 RepID=UPI001F148BD0|nr:hypothetical protein [Cognataquiflexum nitidum]MCH6198054.1 hypothetical protein [Cognataquiflexum nitidum]